MHYSSGNYFFKLFAADIPSLPSQTYLFSACCNPPNQLLFRRNFLGDSLRMRIENMLCLKYEILNALPLS